MKLTSLVLYQYKHISKYFYLNFLIKLKNHYNYSKYSLEHNNKLQFGDKMICVFWDFDTMKWSSNGCVLLFHESDRHLSVCRCNHLTNFAAIMDLSGRENNDYLKSILTNIFCGLSIICLILTILLFLRPKRKRTNTITDKLVKTRNIITLNLCLCLLVSNILVIFGMDRTDIKVILFVPFM